MRTTGQPPIYLTILRKGDINIIDLAEVGSLIPRSETQVDEAFLQELAAEVMRLATPGHSRRGDQAVPENLSVREPSAVVHDLQRIGGLIFSHLLTEPARKRLRTAAPCDLYLRLDEQLIQVPWELCYDGQDFLATKFRMGRQVITGSPIPAPGAVREVTGPLKVLLIADPTESLPQAGHEAEQLCALLDTVPGVEVTLLGGKGTRKVPLLAALQAHEVVHFAGHSFYDSTTPSKSGWRLHEGVLTAGEVSKLSRPPLLVFSNSCQAGATAEWEGGYRYEGQAFGLGSAFLLAGVPNYIGTFWVVHDEESVLLATAFYRSLAAGLSLGGALLQARQEVIKQRSWQGLTWASYLLYGDPTLTLLPAVEESPRPASFPVEKAAPRAAASAPLQLPKAVRPEAGVQDKEPPARPTPARIERKLSAILSADVQGYSRLMGDDEVATIRTLTAYQEVMATLIQQHRGRVVDAPGDNLLAEFASAVDAVQCAIAIQRALQARNAEVLPHRKMEFRLGINVGDVVVEGEKIYGEGVNIAARLEGLAEGGGICISGTVYDQIANKLGWEYEYLGEQAVKNIAKPVRVYRVLLEPGAAVSAVSKKQESAAAEAGQALPNIPYEEHSPWEAVRRYEREQYAGLDILGRPASIDTHYQVLPLLREVKRERLPRAGRGRRVEQESAEGHEEEHGGLRGVDILRWEEELREERVTYERVSLEQVFNDFQSAAKRVKTAVPRFVVLGPPGSGKTTLEQYLGWKAANEILYVSGRPLLPAWIQLREWEAWATQEGSREQSLPAYLTKRYKGLSSAPSAAQWQRWLQKGEVLLLLDGLDEIEGKPFFLSALKTALMTFPECPTILTCRTVSFEQHRTLCPDFPIFTLAGLDTDKRNAAIGIFPAEHRDRYDPDSLIAQLNRTPQLFALAANPLLLNVICYVVDDAKGVILPATRAELYQKALEKLLIHRPQGVEVRYPAEEPHINEKLVILERTALNLFVEGDRRLTFTEKELGQALKQALSEEGYGEAPAPWANALRVDLTRNSGILRGSPRRDYFFLHLTVQEFLAAGAIARLVNEQGWDAPMAIGGTRVSVRHVVDRKAWDPRWQEVILLLAGQLGDPAPLLKLLADEKQDDMFRHRLALAALCLSEGRLAVGNPQATLVDRITTAAISYWFRHEKNSTTAAVPHLTQALPALGQVNGCMGGTPLLHWLCQRLRDPDADVRAGAAEALGQIGAAAVQHPEVLSALVTALHNPDVLVRSEAVEALRRMGAAVAQHPEVLTTLGEVALHDPDRLIRTGAARALQQMGATAAQPHEVLPALEAVPHSENQHVRPCAADLLKQVGVETIQHPEALPTLVQVALHDPDVVVRSEAARVLGQLGAAAAQHSEVLPTLVQALHAEDRGVRSRAARVLGQLGAAAAQHPEVLYSLEEVALHDGDGGVRSEAAEALGRMGEPVTQHPGVCLALVRMTLHDKDGGVRSRAAGALGQIGEAATRRPEVLSALVASLRDKDTNVRFRAAEALGQMMAQGVRVFQRWWRKVEGKKVEELTTLPQ